MYEEEKWIGFNSAAHEITKRVGCGWAEAKKRLREALGKALIDAMKAPLDGPGDRLDLMPYDLWENTAHRDWRDREVDEDGPDRDGCEVVVMVREDDFQRWLAQQKPLSVVDTRGKGGKQARILALLREMFPGARIPSPDKCPRKQLKAQLISRDQALSPLDESTLKKAIDQHNNTILPAP